MHRGKTAARRLEPSSMRSAMLPAAPRPARTGWPVHPAAARRAATRRGLASPPRRACACPWGRRPLGIPGARAPNCNARLGTSAPRPVPSVSRGARGARLSGSLALGSSSQPPARSPPRTHRGSPTHGSPPHSRGSPAYSPLSPAYSQRSPLYMPPSPAYSPCSPACSPHLPAPGGDRGTKRKCTTGFDCDESEVKVVRIRTAEDRNSEAHDNNEVTDLS